MQITRRHLLALSAATAAAAVAGVGGTLWRWWDRPPGAGFAQLSPEEAAFVNAFSGAAFPPGATLALDGAQAGLDACLDGILAALPATTADLLKLLLHALDTLPVALDGARFCDLDPPRRQARLMAWLSSDIAELRGGALSLVTLLGMGYTTHPQVAPVLAAWHGCGYGR